MGRQAWAPPLYIYCWWILITDIIRLEQGLAKFFLKGKVKALGTRSRAMTSQLYPCNSKAAIANT